MIWFALKWFFYYYYFALGVYQYTYIRGQKLVIQSKCLIRYELGISSMNGLHVHVGKSSRITTLHFGLSFFFFNLGFQVLALWLYGRILPACLYMFSLRSCIFYHQDLIDGFSYLTCLAGTITTFVL